MNNSKSILIQEDGKEVASQILNRFNSLLIYPIEDYASKKRKLMFSTISTNQIKIILETVEKIFSEEDIILNIPPNTVVVGDLHGNLLDLLRILRYYKSLTEYNYLFLGDLIDRGQFSLETSLLIFSLKISNPNKVWIIRGNHEFFQTYSNCGFLDDLLRLFPNNISSLFSHTFSKMPLAAIIDNYAFCVHGGFGPSISSIKDILSLQRPIETYKSQIVTDLVWSDPTDDYSNFHKSTRGYGHLFGSQAIKSFLDNFHLQILVRGHQCISKGIAFTNENKVLTIFSASSYCGQNYNCSGSALFLHNHQINPISFEPLPYLLRQDVEFTPPPSPDLVHLIKPSSLPNIPSNYSNHSNFQPRKLTSRIKRVESDIPMPPKKNFNGKPNKIKIISVSSQPSHYP